ncbi:MAG: glutaredoxin 3 [Caulobacteraceae bacterium]|nr:glutaredoxin 3 [Caulobacteraceae bacterium]
MQSVVIYTREFCSYCSRALALLQRKGVEFEQIDATMDQEKRAEMRERSGRSTFPQIFIGGKPIGGSDELHALEQSGELDRLLNG